LTDAAVIRIIDPLSFLKEKKSKLMRLSYSLCVHQFQLLKHSTDFQDNDFAKQDLSGWK